MSKLLQRTIFGLGDRRVAAVLAVIAALAALCVATDDPGLRARFFSHLDERPVLVRTDDSVRLLPGATDPVFHYPFLFRIQWEGWIQLDRAGTHGFRLITSDRARLLIDGREWIGAEEERVRKITRVELEPGLHRLVIELDHVGEDVALTSEFRPPGGVWGPLPAARLYDRRPGPLRRLVRAGLEDIGPVARSLLATVLWILAFAAAFHSVSGPSGRRFVSWMKAMGRRRWLAKAGLGGLFVVSVAAILPRTGSPFGFDDVRYLHIAAFDLEVGWVLNRYAHVYLLDPFIWLAGGDAFLGARLFWSVQFGFVVCALAVCAASLGPRLQLATFIASLLLLFCQPLYFSRAGASVPDTTVGTLVIVAVALFLHRLRWGAGRFEWQLVLVGALTVWAFKSKELGVILLWIPFLFLFESGRFDGRSLVRKSGAWLAGAGVGLALLMVLDGVYFGDPLFGLRPEKLRAVKEFNLAADPQMSRESMGWLEVVWNGKSPAVTDNPRMRYMALLICIAALLAAVKKREIELRLLHLMPLLYFLLLTLVHVRATYVFLARYLYPIVPVACFLGAVALHYLGLDDLTWDEIRSPRFYIPATLLVFLVVGLVVPYETMWIEAADFLPAAGLAAIDWLSLDAFVRLVAGPVLVLTLFLALVVFLHHRATRVLLATTLIAIFLGLPFARTWWELRTRRAWQRGETHLHALRVFEEQIPKRSGVWLQANSQLRDRHRMFGYTATCERIIRVFLDRRDLRVTCWPEQWPQQDVAILSRENYEAWLDTWPSLADTALFSPAGEIVLVRPRDAENPPSIFDDARSPNG